MTLSEYLKEKRGRCSALAALLAVEHSTVARWASGERRIPAERVAQISEATGIAPHMLRGDVFPAPVMADRTDARR